MKTDHTSRISSFFLIEVGLLFFCNPLFASVDFLPDWIGCLIIAWALCPLSGIHQTCSDCRKCFLRLAAVDICRDLFLIVIFGLGTAAERPALLLIAAFFSATVGLFFAIPAFWLLFNGLDALAMTYDCPYVYMTSKKGTSRASALKRFITGFLIFRECTCLLPEFTALFNSEQNNASLMHLYDYIGSLRIVACMICAVGSIVFLLRIAFFFHGLRKEKKFLSNVGRAYLNFLSKHPSVPVRIKYTVSFVFLSIGAFLLTDFYLDGINILPDGFAAFFLLLGILALGGSKKRLIPAAALAVLYGAVSSVSGWLSYRFYLNYGVGTVDRSEKAAAAYNVMWLVSLLELIVFLAFLLFVFLLLRQTVREKAGYLPEHTDKDFEQRRLEKLREEFDGSFIFCYFWGFLGALCSFLFDYIQQIPEKGFFRLLEAFWMVDFSVSIAFACIFAFLLTKIMRQIMARYQFE